jgi:polysaccharide biosynthesis/export protein
MMRFIFALIAVLLLASCVSNKKVTLLQKNDVNKKHLPVDTLVRQYTIERKEYRVQPEDIVSIRIESLTPEEFDVFNRPGSQANAMQAVGSQAGALLLGELVDAEGYIPFLLTGKVKVGGLTIFEIQDTLQSIANQSLKMPIVKVRLINYRFTILGEVNNEGTVQVGNNRVSMIEAIGLAGGMTELADRANIKLIRQYNGKAEVFYLNLLQEDFIDSPLYYAQPNDVLIVPPLKQRPFRKYFGQNFSLILSAVSVVLLVINLSQ